MIKRILIIGLYLSAFVVNAQISDVSGEVYDEYLEPFTGAIVKSSDGKKTISEDGTFTLKGVKLPTTITVFFQGFGMEKKEITKDSKKITFILKETSGLEEVVVSASRTPERILESPVTVERFGIKDVKEGASLSFYDDLENLKGVDINTSSFGFKSINTRGFAGFENPRFVQLVDGIDNVIPSLSYAMGNMAGSPDIDVESVEILPGAASALYGANAFNGIMLMKTKSPFDHQGITVQLKPGMTQQKLGGNNPFYDASVRLAYAFNKKLAAKVVFSYNKAEEWHAGDTRNSKGGEIVDGDYTLNDYNGINVYGDEVRKTFLDAGTSPTQFQKIEEDVYKIFNSVEAEGFLWEGKDALYKKEINRTGYQESALVTNEAKKMNFNGSLHFRPLGNEKLELIWNSRINQWDNLYQGRNRIQQKDFFLQQHKFEIKGDDFFVRAYYSQNKAGKSYDLKETGEGLIRLYDESKRGPYEKIKEENLIKELLDAGATQEQINDDIKAWKKNKLMPDWHWYEVYNDTFLQYYTPSQDVNTNRLSLQNAFKEARLKVMDKNYIPGTSEFNSAFNKVVSNNKNGFGSLQEDETNFYSGDIQFNLKNYINWVELVVGSSYRFYELKSFGTTFTDKAGSIRYDEFGSYLQAQKSMFDKRLKLTGSIRYDKTTNYDGNYSPRVALTFAAGKNRGHNFRVSYQTAFRNPTALEQYMMIKEDSKNFALGSAMDNIGRYEIPYIDSNKRPHSFRGLDIFQRSITKKSYEEYLTTIKYNNSIGGYEGDWSRLKRVNYTLTVTPEQLESMELGYRALLKLGDNNLLEIDLNGYYNTYTNMITEKDLLVSYIDETTEQYIRSGYQQLFENNKDNPEEVKKLQKAFEAEIMKYYVTTSSETNDYLTVKMQTNSNAKVNSWGGGIRLKTKIFKNFDIGGSYSYVDFDYNKEDDPDFTPNFNTPKHKAKLQFGNKNLFKNFGFNIQARWQDKYYWVSPFLSGAIDERTMLDAQLNLRIPSMKSTFKLGGTNLTGKEYFSGPGTGAIGTSYYLSWTIND